MPPLNRHQGDAVKVRMLRATVVAGQGVCYPGDVVKVSEQDANLFVTYGKAERVLSKSEEAEAERQADPALIGGDPATRRETATAAPAEDTAADAPKSRKAGKEAD